MKVVVHVDGGARGNPGPAAVAAVASSPEGDELGERNEFIGEATNNVAEYRALLLGLELARELGRDGGRGGERLGARRAPDRRRVQGQARRAEAALPRGDAELRDFESWAVRPVRREHNARADELVNEALDRALG